MASPTARARLNTVLSAGALLKIETALAATGEPVLGADPLIALLSRVKSNPLDEDAVADARRRFARIVVRGSDLASLDAKATAALVRDLATVPVGQWPAKYHDGRVVSWDQILTASVPVTDPHTRQRTGSICNLRF